MIVVVEQYNAHKYSKLIDEMFRLRARIFHDRLKWDVRVADGKEIDKYDKEGPVYIVYTDNQAREVKGSLRLLPTTGPTLLADVFADTLPDAVHLSAPTIWECTRFCLSDAIIDRGRRHEILLASAFLFEASLDLAMRAGIESIIGNFDGRVLRLLKSLGCEVEILGSTSRYGRPIYLGLYPISESIVRGVKERLTNTQSGVARTLEIAA